MIVLDTTYVSFFQHPDDARGDSLRERLVASPDKDIVTTAITVEEQMRGWLSAIHGQPDVQQQVKYYERLVGLVRFFAAWRILPFDDQAATMFESLRRQRIRIGTMDLKIASIVLVHDGTLLSNNLRDSRRCLVFASRTGCRLVRVAGRAIVHPQRLDRPGHAGL